MILKLILVNIVIYLNNFKNESIKATRANPG